MNIGKLQLDKRLVMAPMAGITDSSFRQLALEMGCGLVFTEMMSAEGLIRNKDLLPEFGREEHPVSVQLFGSDPEVLAKAAVQAEAAGADAVDINMGCPAKKIVHTGAGADLMRFPEKIQRILHQVRREVKAALTIKMRAGWDKDGINAVEISRIAEDCGVDAITVHPRMKVQGFAGQADWKLIGEVKKAVGISVIGNGDVSTPFHAKRMLQETGCDGVMIGRGALGNPWIFGEDATAVPSLKERRDVIRRHFSLLEGYYGEKGAVREIRKHLFWYTRGLPCSSSFRSKVQRIRDREALFEALTSYFASIDQCKGVTLPPPSPLFAGRYCRTLE